MRLESIFHDKERSYIYMERYVNDGSPSGFDRIHTSSPDTAPRGHADRFELLVLRFDDRVRIRNVGTQTNLLPKQCMFCHPDNLKIVS